jgi:putative nucleotidyltransferase with HDIG domain
MPKLSKSKIDVRTDNTLKFFIAFITALLITAMFPKYETIEADYTVGMVWGKEDLIAPFSFPIYKSEQVYQKEVQDAKDRVAPVFDRNEAKFNGQIDWLDSLNTFLTKVKKVLDYQNELNKDKNLPEEKRTTSEQSLANLKNVMKISLNDNEWNALYNYFYSSGSNTFDNFRKKLIQSMTRINDKRIINISKNSFRSDQISFIRNKFEEPVDKNDIRDTVEVTQFLKSDYESYFNNPAIIGIALKISNLFIYPDFTFNKEETDKQVASLTEAVPKTFGIVRENERIVSKHDPINEVTKLKLESYRKIRNEQMGSRDYWVQQGGRFLFSFTMLFLIGIFLFKMRYEIFKDNTKLILLSTIILLQCLFSYLSLNIEVNFPIEYMIFVPVAAMLLTIIFDSRLSVYTIIIICILVSAIRGGDYDIKNRSQIFVSMIYILSGYVISILAIGFERYDSFNMIKYQLYAALLNSVLSPILAYGLLIFYEKVFRVATDLVFLELSDFNHPLLRELASKAPGSFHHSVVMGNLSESAAKEIGANQILARVGCYYHDIGKVVSPNYFVENQLDSKNKHEQLNPSLSAKMIISHVKNGIKLAEKYRIPKEIISFIPMHHGTTLVSYFYEKARTEEEGEDTVHDYIYRYPGPKPHSKETGIVMLADAVEAATRAVEDPTPAKLETQIDQIIKSRFIEGELDECDLTLQDLIKIKYSFLKTIVGIHHHRIKYPEKVNEENR